MSLRIVLATRNRKKRLELEALLRGRDIEVVTLDQFANVAEVVEDGHSFRENAHKKARQVAQELGAWALGEDSGLSVDALGGAPGIFSARYAGSAATDASNNERLLSELNDVPLVRRGAHYTCHAAISAPTGEIVAESEGRCWGRIRLGASGEGGFGYDPLFEIVEYHRTFAELGPELKKILSHRGRALRQLLNCHPLA